MTHQPPRTPFPREDEPTLVITRVADLITTAISAHRRGDTDRASAVLASLLERPNVPDWRRAVERGLVPVLRSALALAWARGWQPADLLRQMRRAHGERHVRLISDAIVDELQTYARATIDPRWFAQLDQADAKVWWPADQTYLGARSRQLGKDWARVVAEAVDVLCLLACLARLEQLGPVPGMAQPSTHRASGPDSSDGQAPAVDARVLDRIRALLAKAESTTSEAEAEALIAAAQERMARHNIDVAVLAAAEPGGGARPSGRRIGLDAPYESAKAVLLNAVAGANRCRAVWNKGFGFATVIGYEPDLDAVETLFTSLLVQAMTAMTRAADHTGSGARTNVRAFRRSFLNAYAFRIGERLNEIVQAQTDIAVAESGGSDLLPVLASRDHAVDDALHQMFPALTQKSAGSVTDIDGWYCGLSAADLATLHTHQPIHE